MLSVPSRKQVVLVGEKGSVEFQDMVAATFSSYDPNRTVSNACSVVKLCRSGYCSLTMPISRGIHDIAVAAFRT
jgi:hypothetical protein